MKIETKFIVGDIVYVCKDNSTYEKEPCKSCRAGKKKEKLDKIRKEERY